MKRVKGHAKDTLNLIKTPKMLNCPKSFTASETIEYFSSSQAPLRTMWTSLCIISCVLAVWSGVLVGATDNSHVVLKVRVMEGESRHYTPTQCTSTGTGCTSK